MKTAAEAAITTSIEIAVNQWARRRRPRTWPPSPPTPPPVDEVPEWFYEDAREAAGPVTRASLMALLRAGHVDRQTLVWREGLADWVPVSDVDELDDIPG